MAAWVGSGEWTHSDFKWVLVLFPSQEHWKYDPFSAHMEDNGDIYARGTQVRAALVVRAVSVKFSSPMAICAVGGCTLIPQGVCVCGCVCPLCSGYEECSYPVSCGRKR